MRLPIRHPNFFSEGTEIPDNLTLIDLENDGTNLPAINIKSTPTTSNTGTIMRLEADGTNWGSGASVLNLISDDADAIPLIVDSINGKNAIEVSNSGTSRGAIYSDANNFTITTIGTIDLRIKPATNRITQIGDAGNTSHSLATNDDLFISGKIEVDGTAFFDSTVDFVSLTKHRDAVRGTYGNDSDSNIMWNVDQASHVLHIGVGGISRILLITETGDRGFDFGHPNVTDPTIFIHSANQATDEWISATHDQTDAVIESGKGHVQIKPASDSGVVLTGTKSTTGNLTGVEGLIYINTSDNAIRMYADGAWRDLATW